MKRELQRKLGAFLMEFVVYGVLVGIYYILVLHLLGGWLSELFRHHRGLYAAVALGLIVGQGVLLDVVTHLLLSLFKNPEEDE